MLRISEYITLIVLSSFLVVPLSLFYYNVEYNYNPSGITINTTYASLYSDYVTGPGGSQSTLEGGRTESGFLTGDYFTSVGPTLVDMITGKYLKTYGLFLDDIWNTNTFVNIPTWVYGLVTILIFLMGIFAIAMVFFGGSI